VVDVQKSVKAVVDVVATYWEIDSIVFMQKAALVGKPVVSHILGLVVLR